MRRGITLSVVSVLLVLLALAPVAGAGERDPWVGERGERREEMEEMAEAEILGHLAGEELKQVNRYWETHLRRCPMDALESAQYSIAELHLQRRNPQAAAAALETLLKGTEKPELRSTTHLNLGEICRRHVHNTEAAAKHYRQVTGPRRHHARHYMLAMLIEAGNATHAVKILEGLIARAKEKGEKLALLHQVAALYRRFDMPDQALAIYQQITRDFTPADIATMRKAAAHEANAMLDRMARHQRGEQWDLAERLEWALHQRLRDLRLARRTDEFEAFRVAVEKGLRELEARERRRDDDERGEDRGRRRGPDDAGREDARERRGRDERRERDGERGERERDGERHKKGRRDGDRERGEF